MKKAVAIFFLLAVGYDGRTQGLVAKLEAAVAVLEADPQMKHGLLGLCVVDQVTGKAIYARNAAVGFAAASTQKVVTAAAALDLLGPDYRYPTTLGYTGTITAGVLAGDLLVNGSGDPSLGSTRWPSTREGVVLPAWISAVKAAGIRSVAGNLRLNQGQWGSATIPGGWIWDDIGNYYGAGAGIINWRENQYDILLKSGSRVGDSCSIVSMLPSQRGVSIVCEVTAGPKGSGDRTIIYLAPNAPVGYIRGTIPVGESAFKVSGAVHDPAYQLGSQAAEAFAKSGIPVAYGAAPAAKSSPVTLLDTHLSPPLDSLVYWFFKKSINLYGEAFLKTLALQEHTVPDTEKGVEVIKNFWARHGVEQSSLNILDGSGLSPQNRVSAQALVAVMQYARSRPWFPAFLNALPEINGLRMKSGSIFGARGYTGYITGRDGKTYSFAIIVNNYDGSGSEIQRKMWKLLDVMK